MTAIDRIDPQGHPVPLPESARQDVAAWNPRAVAPPVAESRPHVCPPAKETWTLWSIRHTANAAVIGFLLNIGMAIAYRVHGSELGWTLGLQVFVMCALTFVTVAMHLWAKGHARRGGRV